MGIGNLNKAYKAEELAKDDNIMPAAAGVTKGDMLKGVRYTAAGALTIQSL